MLMHNLDDSNVNVLVIARKTIWERDFLREIIPIDRATWNWIEVTQNRSRWQQLKEVVQCASVLKRVRRGVLVFSSNHLTIREIGFLIRLIKPRILLHLSDEFGTRESYARLADQVDLVVRQHHHGAYNEPDNVAYMPLGYMAGMLEGRNSTDLQDVPPLSHRQYIWSFVGDNRKQDRQTVLGMFANWKSGVHMNNITPAAMFELYKNSIFVPSPRGNVRMDCFRLYEASLAGAIPVVASSREEIADTFCKEQEPPWIIDETWERAIQTCQAELEQPALLQDRQSRLLEWWKGRVQNVRYQISNKLQGSVFPNP